MPEGVFICRHRVTYAECTVGNHIYYARYLDIFEAARGELCRAAGVPLKHLQEQGLIFPVIELETRYLRPARYDDELAIAVWISESGRIRLNFSYEVRNTEGAVLVTGTTRHVCTDLHEKPTRLPEEVLEKLRRYEVKTPVDTSSARTR